MGRSLIWAGVLLIVAGILVSLGGAFWNRVPGNLVVKGKNWTFYFPWGLSLLVSVVGSLLLWLFSKR